MASKRPKTPGERLRELRENHKTLNTQQALATAAGITIATLSEAERNIRRTSRATQDKLARALGVKRFDIWGGGK